LGGGNELLLLLKGYLEKVVTAYVGRHCHITHEDIKYGSGENAL